MVLLVRIEGLSGTMVLLVRIESASQRNAPFTPSYHCGPFAVRAGPAASRKTDTDQRGAAAGGARRAPPDAVVPSSRSTFRAGAGPAERLCMAAGWWHRSRPFRHADARSVVVVWRQRPRASTRKTGCTRLHRRHERPGEKVRTDPLENYLSQQPPRPFAGPYGVSHCAPRAGFPQRRSRPAPTHGHACRALAACRLHPERCAGPAAGRSRDPLGRRRSAEKRARDLRRYAMPARFSAGPWRGGSAWRPCARANQDHSGALRPTSTTDSRNRSNVRSPPRSWSPLLNA